MDKILAGLLALLSNRVLYAAVFTVTGSLGLYADVDAAVKIGSAIAVIIGLVLGVTAENPLAAKVEAAIATEAIIEKKPTTTKKGKKK